jgi:hypothetical protein
MEDKVIIDWRSRATIGTLHSALSWEASIGPQTRSHQAQLLLMLPIVKDNAKTLTVAFTGFTMVNAICMAQKRFSIRTITPKTMVISLAQSFVNRHGLTQVMEAAQMAIGGILGTQIQ